MSTVVSFELDAPDLAAVSAKARTAMNKALKSWGNDYWNRLVKERLSGRPGLNRRSGNLARDWIVETSVESEEMSVTVRTQGAANAYAGIQETGGTIKPIHGNFLWIPLTANLTKDGTARITPSQAIAQPHFISWNKGPIFFGKSPVKQTKKDFATNFGIVPLFVLKRSVTIPARMGAAALFQSMLPTLETSISSAAASAFEGAV